MNLANQKSRFLFATIIIAVSFLIINGIVQANVQQTDDSAVSFSPAPYWQQTLGSGLDFSVKDLTIHVSNPGEETYYQGVLYGFSTPDYTSGYGVTPIEQYNFSNFGPSTPRGFDGKVTLTMYGNSLLSFPLNPNRYYKISLYGGVTSHIYGSSQDSYQNGKAYYSSSFYPCGPTPYFSPETCELGANNGIADIFFNLGTAEAETLSGKETAVTTDITRQEGARIDGGLIAWIENSNTGLPNDIYAYEISTGRKIRVTNDTNNSPSIGTIGNLFIGNRKILWADWTNNSQWDRATFIHDLDTGVTTEITANIGTSVIVTDFDGQRIALQTPYYENPGIYLYDLSTSQLTLIDQNSSVTNPRISGDKILYQLYQGGNDLCGSGPWGPKHGFRLYDIATGEKQDILTCYGFTHDYAIDGNNIIIAYSGGSLSPKGISQYEISTGKIISISPPLQEIIGIDISGNIVVWSDSNDIFIYDIATGLKGRTGMAPGASLQPKISGSTVVWSDYRAVTNESSNIDIYMYQLTPQNQPPTLPFEVKQYLSDGITEIPERNIIDSDVVLLKAKVFDSDNDQVKIRVALFRFDEESNDTLGVIVKESAFVNSNEIVSVVFDHLEEGDYIWKIQAIDEKGDISGEALFGEPSLLKADFKFYKAFSFVYMTDVHVGLPLNPLEETFSQKIKNLTSAFEQISALDPKPKFILIGGDNVELANEDYFNVFNALINQFIENNDKKIKVYSIPGNHDRYQGNFLSPVGTFFTSDYLQQYYNSTGKPENVDILPGFNIFDSATEFTDVGIDWYNYSFNLNGYLFIGLDSGFDYSTGLSPESKGLSSAQMIALENLAEIYSTTTPKIIFMHHPVINTGNEGVIMENRDDFVEYCQNNNVQLVLSGHTHKDRIFDTSDYERPLFIQTRSATKDGDGYTHGFRIIDVNDGIAYPQTSTSTTEAPHVSLEIIGSIKPYAYDSQGNYTGYGSIITDISDSYYTGYYSSTTPQVIILYNTSEDYRFEVTGADEGIYQLDIESIGDGENTTFTATDIPTTAGQNHQYTIDWDMLSRGEKGATLQIDADGDGVFEQTIKADATLQPPTADINGPYEGNEGSPISFDASGSSDPDGEIILYEWDFDGDGIYDIASASSTIARAWGDDYQGEITLRVTDDEGLTDIATTTVTVNNIAPIISNLSMEGPIHPNQEIWAGDGLNFSGDFADDGWLDTHTAEWDFGNETTAIGAIAQENNPPAAVGQVTGNHVYYNAGTYIIALAVTDDDGGVNTDTLQTVVKPIPAAIDCNPETLNLKSNGKWVTCYIELPAGYDVRQIDGSTVFLNGVVPIYLGKEGWAKSESNESNMNHDEDGILKRIVKFDREAVQSILDPGEAVVLTITGKVFSNQGLSDFEGLDTVRVIEPGKLDEKDKPKK